MEENTQQDLPDISSPTTDYTTSPEETPEWDDVNANEIIEGTDFQFNELPPLPPLQTSRPNINFNLIENNVDEP